MVAADVYRPAAIDQLTVVAEQINLPIYKDTEEKNPVAIAKAALKQAKAQNNDVVLLILLGDWLLIPL